MKKYVLFFVILSFLFCSVCFASAETDYPVYTFAAYWRYSADGVTWSDLTNITPNVTQSGLSFDFGTSTAFARAFQLYLIAYTSQPQNVLTDVYSISGIGFAGNSLGTLFDLSVTNQYREGGSNISDGTTTFPSGSRFAVYPSTGLSMRLQVHCVPSDGAIAFNAQGFYIRFSELKVNDLAVTSSMFIEDQLVDINNSLSDLNVSVSEGNQKLDDINNTLQEQFSYTAPPSDVNSELNKIVGPLPSYLDPRINEIQQEINSHQPDLNAWLNSDPTLVSDMMSFSRLINHVMVGYAHSDLNLYLFLSLVAFTSLLIVLEHNLKRGPSQFIVRRGGSS